jgi:hypothetical protein
MRKGRASEVASLAHVERAIHVIRGQKVMLDSDLADVYGVTTGRLNEQVRRNPDRFPEDFMFQLTDSELNSLRSQIATLKTGRGQHRKYLPYVFTEHGAVMLARVLNSPEAVEASIFVVRAFIRMREMLGAHKELAAKIAELDRRVGQHDESIRSLIQAIRQLMAPVEVKTKRIGFKRDGERQ